MPNWKSYDSSVRLLSAILAAHPELRLNYQEIAESFGGNITASAMQFRFRRIKTHAEAIKNARARGIDPLVLEIEEGSSKKISRRFGGDCSVSALENRFRRIKSDAKLLNDAIAQGIDPFTISTDSLNGKVGAGKEISKYYGDCTASALDHRFRPIKQTAKAMRDGIADKFGEDATAKAVSTRFERMKKERGWLTNSNSGANGTTTNGNSTAKTKTPRKKNSVGEDNSHSDDEENLEEAKYTPKKSGLNKTQGGRVAKPRTPRKKEASFSNAMTPIRVDSDSEEVNNVKIEEHANGNHGMEVDEDEDEYYAAKNGYEEADRGYISDDVI